VLAKQKWVCSHGCDQTKYMREKGHGCPHLEAILGAYSGLNRNKNAIGLSKKLSGTPDPEETLLEKESKAQLDRAMYGEESDSMEDEERFRRFVGKNTQISKVKIEVLVARIVRGQSLQQIARDFGYADARAAGGIYRDAIEMLKRGRVKK
jgi:hypothetical protein